MHITTLFCFLRYIGKILWSFSFSNLGSVELYSKIGHTIKIAQFEIPPMKLAEYAHYFATAPENVKGGFGVYRIAEEHLTRDMEKYSFDELTKISLLLFPHSIGSNEFYKKIEEGLISKFPNNEKIKPNTLAKLCKAISKFRIQNVALMHKIENNILKYAEFLTNSHLESIIWSFTMGKKGSKNLMEAMEKEIIKRIKMWKPRQLAFFYYGFAFSKFGSKDLFSQIENAIIDKIPEMKAHYLIKILKGMQSFKIDKEWKARSLVLQALLGMENLKQSEVLNVLELLSESNFLVNNTAKVSLFEKMFENLNNKIEPFLKICKFHEICLLFYTYTANNKLNEKTSELIVPHLLNANKIPKSYFCQTFWAIVQNKYFDIAKDFIPIMNNLIDFGDIKYFFSHDNFIKLSWATIVTNLNIDPAHKKNIDYTLDRRIFECIKDAMLSINPNILKLNESVYLWLQVLALLNSFVPVSEENIRKKIAEINKNNLENIMKVNKLRFNTGLDLIREDVTSKLEIVYKDLAEKEDIEFISDFFDDFINHIDLAIFRDKKQKAGIRIFNKNCYLGSKNQDPNYLIMSLDLSNHLLKNLFGWKILLIEEETYMNYSEEEKIKSLQKILE